MGVTAKMGVLSRRTLKMVGVLCLVYPLGFLSGYFSRSSDQTHSYGCKQQNSTQPGTMVSEPSTSLLPRANLNISDFKFLNAGSCPVQGCNLMREIREVWSHHDDAAKQARSDPQNQFPSRRWQKIPNAHTRSQQG